jgi:hypothetical protein
MEATLRFYDLEKIAKAIVKKTEEKVLKVPAVSAYTTADNLDGLQDNEKNEVYERGYTILDKRPDSQKTKFGLVQYDNKFFNPSESGFYSYLTKDGDLTYGIIFTNPLRLDAHFSSADAFVINIENGKTYFLPARDIYVKTQYKLKDFSDIYEKMEAPAEGTPSLEKEYILVNQNLRATLPFNILSNREVDGVRQLDILIVHLEHYQGQEKGITTDGRILAGDYHRMQKHDRTFKLIFTKRLSDKLDFVSGSYEINVPKGFKLM